MQNVGILTAGGDSPGLNAAIRAVGKCLHRNNYRLIGFQDGFEGIAFNHNIILEESSLSGILTVGGTILRTSRHRPQKMPVGHEVMDMTGAIIDNYRKNQLECLVCIGGGGTHKSASLLQQAGLNLITMPKTIDNDVACTDTSIGFDTALGVATEAIDSLHSTASSHRRVMLVEIMGHNAGWLALGSGLAGGADIILIPEIPYQLEKVADALQQRTREGKLFSIMPIAEGALSQEEAAQMRKLEKQKSNADNKADKEKARQAMAQLYGSCSTRTFAMANRLEALTGLETRVTILGHLQRGGKPSCADRLLASRLGQACAEAILQKQYGVMIASCHGGIRHVPIAKVAGARKSVPLDHPWIQAARGSGVSFGD